MPYSYELDEDEEKKTAKAYGKEINMSPKKANEVCYAVRGMKVDKALAYLEQVVKKKAFVPFRRYNKKVGHRAGGVPGRYPVKAAKKIIELIKNAKANAVHKGLNDEKLKIEHITAYKSTTWQRGKPKGKMKTHNIDLTNVEVILREC
jgi:large subunit ribosomal protein L22